MHTHQAAQKKSFLLRGFLIGLVVLSVVALIFMSNDAPVQAAKELTLRGNDTLIVKRNGCSLHTSNVKPTSMKVSCEAFTPTPTNTGTPTNTPPPGQDETVFSFISQSGDYIGLGQSEHYTTIDTDFNVNLNGNHSHISFSIDQELGDYWTLDLAAPAGEPLVVGAYENATRYPFQAAEVPGLSFYGNGRGCNTLTGRFTVHEADFTPDHYVERFHATFEQHCEGFAAALFGEIQIVNAEATPTPTGTATATDLAPEPIVENNSVAKGSQVEITHAKIERTLKGGKSLKVLVSGCTLQVKKNKAKGVTVFCKPNPTPTRTNTPKPSTSTLYVGNATGGTLCYEVYGTGVGQKCFGEGLSLYGTFTPGYYSVHLSARCGTLDFNANFPAGTFYDGPYVCTAGARIKSGAGIVPYVANPSDSLATPVR